MLIKPTVQFAASGGGSTSVHVETPILAKARIMAKAAKITPATKTPVLPPCLPQTTKKRAGMSKENVAPPNAPRNSNTCPILCHTIAMPYAKMHQMIMTGKKTLFGQPSRNAGTKRPESDSIDSLALKVISGKLNRLVKATPIRATSAGAVNGRHFVGSELQCLHKKVPVYLDEVAFWR